MADRSRTETVTCPECHFSWDVGFARRQTNLGHEHLRDLEYFLNTSSPYEATREPKSTQRRQSGAGVRPDLKLRLKSSCQPDFIFVERQEQNTTGTGCEKVANKIQKANVALRDLNVRAYYIVIAGSRVDLLQRAAADAFERNGAYHHERLVILHEDDFKQRAGQGRL